MYRQAAYTILKRFACRVAQTASQAYTMHGSKQKPLEIFNSYASNSVYAGYISGYPGQDESCPLKQSLWNNLEGYVLKDTPSTSLGQVAKLLFEPIRCAVREKAFGSFSPVTRHMVTFPVTLGGMNRAHYKKSFETLAKGMC